MDYEFFEILKFVQEIFTNFYKIYPYLKFKFVDKNLCGQEILGCGTMGCQLSNLNTQYDIKKFYLGFKKQFDFFNLSQNFKILTSHFEDGI